MDEQVLRAMDRWPDVPAAFGWLRLGRRGQWFLVDRNRPDFDEAAHGLGSPISNPKIIDFIDRNYGSDADGRWHWQNGPQRAYADLEVAPRIARVLGSGDEARFVDHTGTMLEQVHAAGIGPDGSLLLDTSQGCAAVHDLDLSALSIELPNDGEPGTLILGDRRLTLRRYSDPPREFGFVSRPRG